MKYLASLVSLPEFVRGKSVLVTGMEMKAYSNRKLIMDLPDHSAIGDISHIT